MHSPYHASSRVARDQNESLLGPNIPHQSTNYQVQKRMARFQDSVEVEYSEVAPPVQNPREKTDGRRKVKRRVHWMTPLIAILLFILGLGAAIGHYAFFAVIDGKPIGDQIWTVRYSLAIAFIFKSTLSASISVSLAQHAWLLLQRKKAGTHMSVVDAMFLAESALFRLLFPSLWFSAFSVALMAACIWLMPLTALVAPTALSIGTAQRVDFNHSCIVPMLNMDIHPNFTIPTDAYSLFVTNEADNFIRPSTSSDRLTASVLTRGHQSSWSSPCGSNCSYEIEFFGPSWQCLQADDVDDSRAPWTSTSGESYWYLDQYGDGSNITVTPEIADALSYSPVYYAGINATTNQFWLGFATGFARDIDPTNGTEGESLRDVLGVEAYYCEIANTSYSIQVDYLNGVQTTALYDTDVLTVFPIPEPAWDSQTSNSAESSVQDVPIPLQELVGMYEPMMNMLTGTIMRDPRTIFVTNTSLGLVPSLITDLPLYVHYSSETPYLPKTDLSTLLQELSYNLTVSLMSYPELLVVSNTTTTCLITTIETVWKFDRLPLIAAYAAGLGVALVCLGVGARALAVNGVAHDNSFSSIVRTTRSETLGDLCSLDDVGALPLPDHMKTQRLRFLDDKSFGSEIGSVVTSRRGFVVPY